MSVEFKIIIKGIAMSYEKTYDAGSEREKKYWGVLFPFDECHTVKLKASEDEPGFSLAGALRKIKISSNDPESSHEKGDDYDEFLDLTHDGGQRSLHKDGVVARTSWYKSGVLMRLENASFSVQKMSKIRLKAVNIANTAMAAKDFDYIGISGAASITAKDGGYLNVEVIEFKNYSDFKDNKNGDTIFTKRYYKDATIILDNDCDTEEASLKNDFPMLYWIVKDYDPENASRQFITEKEKPPTSPGGAALQEVGANADQSALIAFMAFLFGVFSGVFLASGGLKGLPCHKVRVSKPNGLPELDKF